MAAGAVLRDVDRGVLYFQNVTVHARVRAIVIYLTPRRRARPFVHLTGSVRQHYVQISYSEFHPSDSSNGKDGLQFVLYILYIKRGSQCSCCRETRGLSASSRGDDTAKIHVQCGVERHLRPSVDM